MSKERSELIRRIVDECGWQGLREKHPALWAEIVRNRKADAAYIDSVIDR